MKTEVRHCPRCGTRTGQLVVGFIPAGMFESEYSEKWIDANICKGCESLVAKDIDEETMRWAEEKIVDVMVNAGLMSEEEASTILVGED